MKTLKNRYLIPLLGVFSILSTSLCSFEILPQVPENAKLGLGDFNIETDGELNLMRYLLKPNDIVFDVGANFGEWSLLAKKTDPSIQLISFEPIPKAFNLLKDNLKTFEGVYFFNLALSDMDGYADYYYYSNLPEESGLSGFYFREVLKDGHADPEVITVRQETIDSFCAEHSIPKIDFLKIDAEGAEWKILNGAQNMLKNHQITAIQFEYGGCFVDAKTTLEQVIKLLTDNQYLVFRIYHDGLIHISKWDSSLEDYHLSNYFAIRKEELPEYNFTVFE